MACKTWKYDQKWPCQFVSFRVGWCLEQLPRVPQWHPLGLRGGVVALLKTCRVVLGTYANVSIRVISCRCEAIFWCSCFLSILLNLTLASSDSRFPIYAMAWWSNYIISSLRIHNYWSDSPCWLTGAIATPLKKPWFQNHSDTLWKLLVYIYISYMWSYQMCERVSVCLTPMHLWLSQVKGVWGKPRFWRS